MKKSKKKKTIGDLIWRVVFLAALLFLDQTRIGEIILWRV